MYKLKSVKKNVIAFDAFSHSYSYKNSNNYYLIIAEKQIDLSGNRADSIRSNEDYIYIEYGNDGFCEIYKNTDLIKRLENSYLSIDENSLFFYNSYYTLKPHETYYNWIDPFTEKFQLKEYVPFRLFLSDKKTFAFNNLKGELKRINTETDTIWSFPLSSLGTVPYKPEENDTIHRILGVAHGNLWFFTSGDRLVALSLETGELIKAFSGYNPDIASSMYHGPGLIGNVFFNEQTQNIVNIASNFYTEIDTKTLEAKEQFNYLEADPEGIGRYESIFNPLLQGDYFTFLGELKDDPHRGLRRAGIFDYRTRKLVWDCEIIEPFEKERLGIELISPDPLYMAGNKLYIKDLADRLHIFEREEE